jgi:hypothetical protein
MVTQKGVVLYIMVTQVKSLLHDVVAQKRYHPIQTHAETAFGPHNTGHVAHRE